MAMGSKSGQEVGRGARGGQELDGKNKLLILVTLSRHYMPSYDTRFIQFG